MQPATGDLMFLSCIKAALKFLILLCVAAVVWHSVILLLKLVKLIAGFVKAIVSAVFRHAVLAVLLALMLYNIVSMEALEEELVNQTG